MISDRLKTRKIRTTHSVEMGRLAHQIMQKPEEKRTPKELSILSDYKDEQHGIRTITDVQTSIREKQTQPEQPAPAHAHGIVEQKIEKKAPIKQPINKKPSTVKVKHGKKKTT